MKLFFKAKAMPMGSIIQKKDGTWRIKTAQGWKPHKTGNINKKIDLKNITKEDISRLKNNKALRDKFIKDNQAYVNKTISSMISKIRSKDDAIQDANLGFIEAINNFKLDKSPKAFGSYLKSYMVGNILKKIKKSMNTTNLNISIDDTPIEIKGKGTPEAELEKKEEPKEFSQTVQKIMGEIRSDQAKRVFKYIVAGYKKSDIARITKTSRTNVGKLVNKYIKPVAKKYLVKSLSWQELMEALEEY